MLQLELFEQKAIDSLLKMFADEPEAKRELAALLRREAAKLMEIALMLDPAQQRKQTIAGQILSAVLDAGRPIKGSAVARRCGRVYDGNFRRALAILVRRGSLMHGQRGYHVTGNGVDEAIDT